MVVLGTPALEIRFYAQSNCGHARPDPDAASRSGKFACKNPALSLLHTPIQACSTCGTEGFRSCCCQCPCSRLDWGGCAKTDPYGCDRIGFQLCSGWFHYRQRDGCGDDRRCYGQAVEREDYS